jgi:hypothetical protein
MKLRLLFSVLFVIATSLTALHQLEHIKGAHDSTACSVCIIDHHSVSGDIIVAFEEPLVYKFESISLTSQTGKRPTSNFLNPKQTNLLFLHTLTENVLYLLYKIQVALGGCKGHSVPAARMSFAHSSV